MDPILTVTEKAADYLKGWLHKEAGLGFRLSIKKTGCSGYSYAPAIIASLIPGDLHFQLKNELDVYIDPLCLEQVQGLTLDYVEEQKEGVLKGKKLVFINPNESSRCGCGESFHV